MHLEGGLRLRPGSGGSGLDLKAEGLDLTRLAPLLAVTKPDPSSGAADGSKGISSPRPGIWRWPADRWPGAGWPAAISPSRPISRR
jgi:hypothetical protein